MQVRVYVNVPAAEGVTVCVPAVDWEPVHAPPALQAVAWVVVHVNVALLPTVSVVGLTLIATVGGLEPAAVTVSVAEACAAPPELLQLSPYVYVPAALAVTVCRPDAATLPLHAPLAVHAVAPLLLHVSVALPPVTIAVGATLIETVGPGASTSTRRRSLAPTYCVSPANETVRALAPNVLGTSAQLAVPAASVVAVQDCPASVNCRLCPANGPCGFADASISSALSVTG